MTDVTPSLDPSLHADLRDPGSPPAPDLQVWAGKRTGRSHRTRGEPCQDAYASHVDAGRGRIAAAVADGLGSRPLSQHGSQAACDAAVASLAAEPAAWDREALLRALAAGREAVEADAARRGLEPHELATTLQVAVLEDGRALAAMVGDGAIAGAGLDDRVVLLAAPGTSGYANEVVPITDPDWRDVAQVAEAEGVDTVLLFTDGLTRLLLARDRAGWSPFPPFFSSFLPALPAADEALVDRFLAGDAVDRSWDDDKCLVVMRRAARGI